MEKPEPMATFFNGRAAGYDDYMRDIVFSDTTFAQFYQAVAAPIEKTDEALKILDLGCGTGLEIEALYHEQVAGMPQAEDGHYHIDVPFSIDTQRTLLLEAGFKNFEVVWQKDSAAVWNIAVYVVTP